MTAQRSVWGDTLARLSVTDERVIVLDGDLATSTKADTVAKQNPKAFIQVGIAEQNLVGMAFGLATMGYRPWLSTFGVFLTNRALDQIRMLVSQTKVPVRLCAAYAGLLNGSSGKTHQDIEDLAIMRAMPNMTVLAPADEHEARAVTEWAAGTPLGRHGEPEEVAKAVAFLLSSDASFITGIQLDINGGLFMH